MNDEKQDEVQVAICPTGSKFFWCVVDSMSDEVLAQGRTDTLEEAEEQMWAQAAIHRNSRRRVQVDEDFARRIRRQLWKSDYRQWSGRAR